MSTISTPAAYRRVLLAAFVTTTAFVSPAALAQEVPGPADAGQVERNLRERVTVPDIAPDIQVREMTSGTAPAGADSVRFTLSGLELEGVTAYTDAELRTVYGSALGQNISLADLYKISADLTAKYRNDGYILTQIVVPPQTIEGGTARLLVIEGVIDKIIVQGDEAKEGQALELMRRYAAPLNANGAPLNAKQLERTLLLINDLPGVSARSVIAPSPTRPGAADLTIFIERDPFDAFAGVDNYGSRFLGRWEGTAGASINSGIFNNNEKVSVQAVYAPHGPLFDHELGFISGSYWTPLGNYGTNLEVTYSYTDTEPGLDLRDFDVEGRSHYAAVVVKHPFIRSREMNLTGRVMFDGRNVKSENNIPDNREDEIRALRTGARFDSSDAIFSGGVTTFDIEFAKGLDVLGASDEGDATLTRPDGDPQFFKVEAELQRLQRLTQNFNLLLGVKGQLSNAALLASEEFAVGGATYGRGYDPSEITGEDGFAGKVEVQWNPQLTTTWMPQSQVFAFWDGGKVWNDDVIPDKPESLTSTGVGFRADFIQDIQSEFFIAVPLSRQIQAENDDDARFYFSLSKSF